MFKARDAVAGYRKLCVGNGVTDPGVLSRIADGYAWTTNGLSEYGVAANGTVQGIAFEQYSDASPDCRSG